MTHSDFRPKKRSGVVPSGKPRRKIPLLRILLLIVVAFFVYLKFDSIWSGVRHVANPTALWERAFGHPLPAVDNVPRPAWSPDSTEFTLDCPRGLRGCCDGASFSPNASAICRQAGALLAKAQSRQVLGAVAPESPLRLYARAGVSRTGHTVFDLTALQGRSAQGQSSGGTFAFRQNAAGVWCDSRHVCLTDPVPQAPLTAGRLLRSADESSEAGRWVSASSVVHPVLPGRITGVDSVPGGVRVRIYHGGELYTTYEPLHLPAGTAAAALKPGMAVTRATVLGDAPWLAAGYTVTLRARRAGLSLDPAYFFSMQPTAAADEAEGADGATADSTTPPVENP